MTPRTAIVVAAASVAAIVIAWLAGTGRERRTYPCSRWFCFRRSPAWRSFESGGKSWCDQHIPTLNSMEAEVASYEHERETPLEKVLLVSWRLPLARHGLGLRRVWRRVERGLGSELRSSIADQPGGTPGCVADPVSIDEPRTLGYVGDIPLPLRVVIGKNGAYWRDFGDYYSMCPTSTDNDPVDPVAVYVPERPANDSQERPA